MEPEIGNRVAALLPSGRTSRAIASEIGMTPDAFSRALNGQRGFAAIELARLADVLDADVHFLITGKPDPNRMLVAARHDFDLESGRRDVPGADEDRQILNDVALAYRQAEPAGLPSSALPKTATAAREQLGADFVRPFTDRLESCGIDVVRLPSLSTSYCFTVTGRAVIVVQGTGNWFRENWGLAHELGHLVHGHADPGLAQSDRQLNEVAANAFAAELLLPSDKICAMDWKRIDASDLASRVWELGVSTQALATRLSSLQVPTSSVIDEWADQPTQRLLRRHWDEREDPSREWSARSRPSRDDPITRRMDTAAARRFPLALQDAHLALISKGVLSKSTLAWMLGVDAASLEIDEPAPPVPMASDDVAAALGL